jgi:5'-nucleotidase
MADDPPRARRVYCNRTLNLRSIRAVGFDMDYTLVHYRADAWQERAYLGARARLAERGWPVERVAFDPELVAVGLVLDLQLGNVVKPTQFGYVQHAQHGTRSLDFDAQRAAYARVLVDLEAPRWVFLNELFSTSTATLYAQLVDLLDAGRLPPGLGYAGLYAEVHAAVDAVHVEGALKREIAEHPERFVDPDPELPLALLDLKHAGKRLMIITNSEWPFTRAMLSHALDAGLPGTQTGRDLFDVVIVSARKPRFFSSDNAVFEIVDDSGLLRPHHGAIQPGTAYLGGSAALVEKSLGVDGEQILYLGDHVAADVRASKDLLRWRTGLVLRDLEAELAADETFAPIQVDLDELMARKGEIERRQARVRLDLQRVTEGYGPQPGASPEELKATLQQLRSDLDALDARVAPLARAAGEVHKRRWGPLLRAGSDKSHLARQIERSADVYTSRVSNLAYCTPFAYLRAPRGSLPHDAD